MSEYINPKPYLIAKGLIREAVRLHDEGFEGDPVQEATRGASPQVLDEVLRLILSMVQKLRHNPTKAQIMDALRYRLT